MLYLLNPCYFFIIFLCPFNPFMSSITSNMKLTQESLARILDFLPYPFLIAVTENDTVHVKFGNKKFEEEIGYSIDEISTIDEWFLKAYPNLYYRTEIKAKWMAKVDDAIREKRNYVVERAHITTKHRGQMWYEVKSSLAGDLQLVAFVNIHDVIEKDNKLERLNENKNRILSILGHDLKSPLQNLDRLIQLLVEGGLSKEEFENNLITIQRLSKETLQFIDTTLTWTRSNFEDHKPVLQKFSLHELVCNIVGLYNREFESKKISPLINIPIDTMVFSDREIMHIAIRNIISNAIKFSPAETPIIISFHEREKNNCVTITDEGEGMPPDIIDQILKNQPTKTSGSGFGIGLRLCKEVLQHVKGRLEINSSPGKGTSITVVVPKISL